MKRCTITMSQKETHFMRMCIRIMEGACTLTQAAQQLEVSYRTMQRRMTRFRSRGATGLVHVLRNAPPNHRIDPAKKHTIMHLLSTEYHGYSAAYASELLASEHGITVSASTIRRWVRPSHPAPITRVSTYRARLNEILARQYHRTVQNDCSSSVDASIFQILKPSQSFVAPKQKVLGLRFLDNSFLVYSNGKNIRVKEA